MGHINGKTEILNRSQIAATMASAVGRAMSGVRFNMPNPAPVLQFVARQQDAVRQSSISEERQIQNVISVLTQILTAIMQKDTDVYFDTNKVTNEIVKQINRNTRASGVCEIVI